MLRRLLVALLLAIPIFGLPQSAAAADGEAILQFNVGVTVQSSGLTQFTETIRYDFGSNQRHGLIRAIPRWDDQPNNKRRLYALHMGAVSVDGSPAPMRESDEGAFHMVTIGDPDITISGLHTYVITYSIDNALTTLSAADLSNAPGVSPGDIELYWDFIGDGWDVPITSAQATIVTPGAPALTRCYSGAVGSTDSCVQSTDANVTQLGPVSLRPFQPLTGVLDVPRAAFTSVAPADIIERPAPWGTQFVRAMRYTGPLGVILLMGLVVVARRRHASVKTVPITDFVRFEAPRLRPAAAAAAWKGSFDGRALTATLLDLAARGALVITPKSRKRILVVRSNKQVELDDWERAILDAALGGAADAEIGKYDAKLAKVVKTSGQQLKDRAITTGIRNRKAWSARTPWLVIVGIGFVMTGIGFVLFAVPWLCALIVSVGLALLLGGVTAARLTPLVQTETSAAFLSELLGFRRLLDTDAAAARREFAQRSGLAPAAIFATMLPWAVIFDLDESWAGAFPDLTPTELMAYGLGFASANAVHDDIASATRALSSAMTNPSSGGSGASGGSSGGGGGGGGGGSW